jgi:hypothetical protein
MGERHVRCMSRPPCHEPGQQKFCISSEAGVAYHPARAFASCGKFAMLSGKAMLLPARSQASRSGPGGSAIGASLHGAGTRPVICCPSFAQDSPLTASTASASNGTQGPNSRQEIGRIRRLASPGEGVDSRERGRRVAEPAERHYTEAMAANPPCARAVGAPSKATSGCENPTGREECAGHDQGPGTSEPAAS